MQHLSWILSGMLVILGDNNFDGAGEKNILI